MGRDERVLCGRCRDERSVLQVFERVVTERQIMRFGERLRIEEVCRNFECRHIRNTVLIDDLKENVVALVVRRINHIV